MKNNIKDLIKYLPLDIFNDLKGYGGEFFDGFKRPGFYFVVFSSLALISAIVFKSYGWALLFCGLTFITYLWKKVIAGDWRRIKEEKEKK